MVPVKTQKSKHGTLNQRNKVNRKGKYQDKLNCTSEQEQTERSDHNNNIQATRGI